MHFLPEKYCSCNTYPKKDEEYTCEERPCRKNGKDGHNKCTNRRHKNDDRDKPCYETNEKDGTHGNKGCDPNGKLKDDPNRKHRDPNKRPNRSDEKDRGRDDADGKYDRDGRRKDCINPRPDDRHIDRPDRQHGCDTDTHRSHKKPKNSYQDDYEEDHVYDSGGQEKRRHRKSNKPKNQDEEDTSGQKKRNPQVPQRDDRKNLRGSFKSVCGKNEKYSKHNSDAKKYGTYRNHANDDDYESDGTSRNDKKDFSRRGNTSDKYNNNKYDNYEKRINDSCCSITKPDDDDDNVDDQCGNNRPNRNGGSKTDKYDLNRRRDKNDNNNKYDNHERGINDSCSSITKHDENIDDQCENNRPNNGGSTTDRYDLNRRRDKNDKYDNNNKYDNHGKGIIDYCRGLKNNDANKTPVRHRESILDKYGNKYGKQDRYSNKYESYKSDRNKFETDRHRNKTRYDRDRWDEYNDNRSYQRKQDRNGQMNDKSGNRRNRHQNENKRDVQESNDSIDSNQDRTNNGKNGQMNDKSGNRRHRHQNENKRDVQESNDSIDSNQDRTNNGKSKDNCRRPTCNYPDCREMDDNNNLSNPDSILDEFKLENNKCYQREQRKTINNERMNDTDEDNRCMICIKFGKAKPPRKRKKE